MNFLLSILILMGLSSETFACLSKNKMELKVQVSELGDSVSFEYVTKATYPSMCTLVAQRLELIADPLEKRSGKISFSTIVRPDAACYHAEGPHIGVLTLNLGEQLPSLSSGLYQIVINNEVYGYLRVEKEFNKFTAQYLAPKC